MSLKVIPVASHEEWQKYVKEAYLYDFHHTACFHNIESQEGDEPLLFVSEKQNDYIVLPLIIRAIPGADGLLDATSVYGYGGPISSKEMKELSFDLIEQFQRELREYCEKRGIISVFSRLHPLIEQERCFEGDFGELVDLNKTVAIDLKEPMDIQRQQYSRAYKNQINKLKKRKGYTVKELTINEIDVFKDIYFETMDRVDAKKSYYFSDAYLKTLMDNPCFSTRILAAFNEDGEAVSASMYTVTNKIIQYHLGGTKNIALEDTPIKYVMDEARLLGNELGMEVFHLGGGVGGSDDDSLFRFKKGFSKSFFQFQVWNWVINRTLYDALVQEKGVSKEANANFFPLYRA